MEENFDEYFVQEKSGIDRLLDFLVFIGVLIVTVFLILELWGGASTSVDTAKLEGYYFYANIIVFIIFFVDLIRLWVESHGVKDFFTHNWLDILATIPFGLLGGALFNWKVFNALKWAKYTKLSAVSKVQKLSRVSKISKEFKAAAHLKKEGAEYKKKHRL